MKNSLFASHLLFLLFDQVKNKKIVTVQIPL